MNVDEYVKKTSKQIHNKKEREQFEREMTNHILDKVEYYINSGYDEKTAIKKAINHMGDAEDIGMQMGMVHKNLGRIVFDIVAFLVIVAILLFLLLYLFFFGEDFTNLNSPFNLELVWCILQVVMLALFRKGKHFAVSCALFVYNSLYILMRISAGQYYSQILFVIRLIISGHIKDISLISNTWLKSESITLAVATLLMFALSEFAGLYALKTAKRLTLRPDRKTHKKLNTVFSCFAAATACFAVVSVFTLIKTEKADYNFHWVSVLCFIECDEKVDFVQLDYERDGIYLDLDYDTFDIAPQSSFWWDLELNREEIYFRDINIKYYPTEISKTFYGKITVTNEYSPTKRYIAVIPIDSDEAMYNYAKWFDTEKTDVLEGVLDSRYYCECDYKIKLTHDEAFINSKNEYLKEIRNYTE